MEQNKPITMPSGMVTYVHDRYDESFQFLRDRKKRQVAQLRLLNNLQRGDENIASTLLVTLFNRTLSALYDDKLQIKFLPSQGILQDQINSYNKLAQNDYLEMNKAQIDYDWCWDTLFFGRGYLETLRFNKKRKILEPSVINPLSFGYDPYFEEVQDWRYYWKWITKSKWELQKLIDGGVITGVSRIEEIPSGIDEYLWNYKIDRDKAKKAIQPAADTRNKDIYQILEFYGYDEDGNRCVFWIDRGFSKLLMKDKLELDDGEPIVAPSGEMIETTSRWPIVVKEAFREPHSTVMFSVADILDDKHRAKSVLLNLAYIAAKDKANPLYWYDPDKVKDVAQFFSRQINQHIPVEGDGNAAVGPINKEDPMSAGLLNFISMLTTEANEPIGTGTTAQPEARKVSNTATEAAIDQQLSDMAQSLFSKVFQFGEAEFWSHWFARYKKYGPAIKDKFANIVGVKGVDSIVVDMKDFQCKFPPGIMVYSAKEAEYKELVLRRDLMQLYPTLAQTLDQEGLRNFNKHVFFPKFLQDPSLIDIMLPKTIDEMKAEDENEQLKEDIMPQVAETDEHETHIFTHYQVVPKTWATFIHINWHQELLAQKKQQEMQQAQMQAQGAQGNNQSISQPNVGAEQRSPVANTAPLKGAINSFNQQNK